MSENVGSSGVMVPLSRKLTREECEMLTEEMWKGPYAGDVNINYEGTLAYTDHRSDGYGISFGVSARMNDLYLIQQELDRHDLSVTLLPAFAKPYTCYWYNGVDSDMDTMTLENFLKMTGQVHE